MKYYKRMKPWRCWKNIQQIMRTCHLNWVKSWANDLIAVTKLFRVIVPYTLTIISCTYTIIGKDSNIFHHYITSQLLLLSPPLSRDTKKKRERKKKRKRKKKKKIILKDIICVSKKFILEIIFQKFCYENFI